MRLISVQVQNFRSVEDSTEFKVDDLTCLVGKNEAGKTAILQALHALNPLNKPNTLFDVDQDYPRRFVTRYNQRHPETQAVVVATSWEINQYLKDELAVEYGADAVTGSIFTITKHYKAPGTYWTVPIDENAAVRYFIEQSRLNAAEKKQIQGADSANDLISKLESISGRTEKHNSLLKQIKERVSDGLYSKARQILEAKLPKFFYVSHYDRMSGQISINKLAQDRQQDKVQIGDEIFLNFLELAGTSIEELQKSKKYEELIAKCEAASNEITEQIFTYWTQNDSLEVKLDFSEGRPEDPAPYSSGTVVRARVWNILHRASVPFSERSAGFVWFFSFLVQFAALRNLESNIIILLDEPGLTLHGKAQADLLRYVEKELLPHHQVMFSTHSPFMVPADRFSSVRIVEDVVIRSGSRPEVKGTKVRADVLANDRDTLFPLQGALGYDIAQSLFIGQNSLLVEGPSDILYLQALSAALKRRGRAGLSGRWIICPSGGIDKIRPFVSLFGGNGLNVVVLTDFGAADKRKIEDLRRSEILASTNIFTAADFTGKSEADVEDFFEPGLFAEILNQAYNLPEERKLSAKLLAEAENTPRQVKQAEAAFRRMPNDIPEFDHFTPSDWLIRHPQILDSTSQDVDKTLERAQLAFDRLNTLVKS
ncbi:ATP-dependent nuclease [Methylobacterium aquaticum]|uniref:ATP-dependent nuclease n=1 Tax=Methylobacterium aquaticum TaxID=270351 RepID=UPI001AFC6AF8|nr:AAA family ATPase [Methylobacterium aquaticum]QRE75122.1 AAA family ATPase [Methylobacterium aquaticum]